MSETPTPETDAMEVDKDEAVCRSVVPSIFARRLERERNYAGKALFEITWKLSKQIDEALKERDEARRDRDEARRDLVAAEELHRRRFSTVKAEYDAACTRLAEAERERDEARRDRDDSMEELALMQKKLASLIRRWKGRKKEYLNAVTLALEKGDKSASCRYHGESIGTHWAIEDLELILKRKEEAK